MVLSNTNDDTVTMFEKLTLAISSREINHINNNNFKECSTRSKCKNNINKCANSVTVAKSNNSLDNQKNTFDKTKINTINIMIDDKKIKNPEIINKIQTNKSFCDQKLWEINRVNQILHNKISNGVKSTYSRQNSSTCYIKATSTINREKKNKEIMKENMVSFLKVKLNR